jgi:hypothetical protein
MVISLLNLQQNEVNQCLNTKKFLTENLDEPNLFIFDETMPFCELLSSLETWAVMCYTAIRGRVSKNKVLLRRNLEL